MDRPSFETELRQQGYAEIVDRAMAAGAVNPEHSHEFDAKLLILDGAMTITCGGDERTYHAGETFTMDAGCRHAERGGLDGVRYLAGRRHRAGA